MNLKTIQTLWTDLTQAGKLILGFAAVLVVGSIYHSCTTESKLETFRKQYNAYRDSVVVSLKRADSLNLVMQSQQNSARLANARADSLSRRLASLQVENTILHRRNDSIVSQVLSDTAIPSTAKAAIAALQQENDNLRNQIALDATRDDERVRAIAQLEGALEAANKRADELQSRLRALPASPKSEKLFGVIALPSRTTSFFIGAMVGIVANQLVERAFGK